MKSLKRLVVIDLEATCWERGMQPQNQRSEIIEIGVCLVDAKQLCRIDKRSIMVKPRESEVSKFCTDLTGITREKLESHGVSLDEAIETLSRDFLRESEAWASYGDYDRIQLQSQLGDKFPFGTRHVNVKTLAGSRSALIQKSVSMLR